jgi:hypothetical protein
LSHDHATSLALRAVELVATPVEEWALEVLRGEMQALADCLPNRRRIVGRDPCGRGDAVAGSVLRGWQIGAGRGQNCGNLVQPRHAFVLFVGGRCQPWRPWRRHTGQRGDPVFEQRNDGGIDAYSARIA